MDDDTDQDMKMEEQDNKASKIVDEIMESLDKNKDDEVSYDEFDKFVKKVVGHRREK